MSKTIDKIRISCYSLMFLQMDSRISLLKRGERRLNFLESGMEVKPRSRVFGSEIGAVRKQVAVGFTDSDQPKCHCL